MLLALGLAVTVSAPAAAGELIFANGSRLAGDLSSETLMMSTGAGLVEIAPDEIVVLSHEEVRLRDGRVIRGTLVGGQIKAQTTLGEIAIKIDELQSYRSAAPSGAPAAAPVQGATPPAATASASPSPAASAAPAASGSTMANGAISSGLPTVAAYQEARPPSGNGAPKGTVQPAVLTRDASPAAAPSRTLEVLTESGLYRDALFSSSEVGRVAVGQQVRYVDSIDRRLRILNLLVFDGGYWIKVRLPSGTEGWVPADTVREVR